MDIVNKVYGLVVSRYYRCDRNRADSIRTYPGIHTYKRTPFISARKCALGDTTHIIHMYTYTVVHVPSFSVVNARLVFNLCEEKKAVFIM